MFHEQAHTSEDQLRSDASASQYKSASIRGEANQELLENSIEIANGKSSQARKFKSQTTSIGHFIAALCDHRLGEKDGPCFLQGALEGNRRKTSAVTHLDLMVFDVDNGSPIEEVHNRLAELNLLGVIYTTHSSGKDQSEIGRDPLLKHFDLDDNDLVSKHMIAEFLRDQRGYHSSVLDVCEVVADGTGPTGVMVVRHAPMTKFRVVLFLEECFSLPTDHAARKGAVERWKKSYASVAAHLGIPYDKSCTDVSRLFYLPRHAEGAEHRTEVLFGDLLDLSAVPSMNAEGVSSSAHSAGSGERLQNRWLLSFVAEHAKGFEAADFIEDHWDHRGTNGNFALGRCPNDDAHSNPGDDDDTAFFAVNASQSDSGSFVLGCHHNVCNDLDRLGLLDLIVAELDLTEGDLTEYVAELEENSFSNETPNRYQANVAPPDNRDWGLEEWVEHFNKNYAVVAHQGQTFVIRTQSRQGLEYFTKQAFMLFHANCRYVEGAGKDLKAFSAAHEWLKSPDRRSYEGVCFNPKHDAHSDVCGKLNQWTGLGVDPVAGEWSLLREHIFQVVCQGDEVHFDFLMTWMAQMVRFPAEKKGSAVVLLGKKGTGKSFVFDALRQIVGAAHTVKLDKAESFTGRFNVQLETAIFVQVEEASWGGDKSAEGVLKNLITSDEIFIEAKGRTPYMAENYARIGITSNEQWVVPASSDERRFFVLKVGDSKQGNIAYFGAIHDQLKAGGYQAMMYDLMAYEPNSAERWDTLRNPPKTVWLREQIDHSKSSVERFVDELIEVGIADFSDDEPAQPMVFGDRACFRPSILYRQYSNWCALNGVRSPRGQGNSNLVVSEIEKRVELDKINDTERRGLGRGVFYDVVDDWSFPED